MTLDERYKIQKKKSERLEKQLARLKTQKDEFDKNMDAKVDEAVSRSLEEVSALMEATVDYAEELERLLAEAKAYADEGKSLVADLRELKSEVFKHVKPPADEEEDE